MRSGVGGIPTTGVAAVALNLGAQATRTDCWVQVQPAGTPTSNASYPRVDTYAATARSSWPWSRRTPTGDLMFSTNCSSADIFADVEGYYLADQRRVRRRVRPDHAGRRGSSTPDRVSASAARSRAGRTVDRDARRCPSSESAACRQHADAVALNVGTTNGTARATTRSGRTATTAAESRAPSRSTRTRREQPGVHRGRRQRADRRRRHEFQRTRPRRTT